MSPQPAVTNGLVIPATTMTIKTKAPEAFGFLFQEGVQVECEDGCTVREFLCLQMHVCGDYAESRIQTLFLNHKPVDDFDTAVIFENDSLALSAAMPGLVGSTLRRGGYYAEMRGSISYGRADDKQGGKRCLINLRLFNFLARELAERFLLNGVYLKASRFRDFLQNQPDSFFSQLESIAAQGRKLPVNRNLCDMIPGGEDMLHITLDQPGQ